jgi:hypothetical protein
MRECVIVRVRDCVGVCVCSNLPERRRQAAVLEPPPNQPVLPVVCVSNGASGVGMCDRCVSVCLCVFACAHTHTLREDFAPLLGSLLALLPYVLELVAVCVCVIEC